MASSVAKKLRPSTSSTEESALRHNDDGQGIQVLVRFQCKTHAVRLRTNGADIISKKGDDNDNHHKLLLNLWSERTGWPCKYLRISSWNLPFCDVVVKSSLRGGKGGFGTLLKGQSRQAGAKLTTDFGACRDLQGRRLRHVNDEIKLRKWRELQRRRESGENVSEKDELWNTPSGIYNWHLMTPTWADISKKATYRIKRQFQKMDREEQKRALMRKEKEEAYQKSMTHYLEQTTLAAESIQENLSDALKQGLEAAKGSNKRKRGVASSSSQHLHQGLLENQEPNSLCTLSGDVVVGGVVDTVTDTGAVAANDRPTSSSSSVQLQSKSEFSTAVFVLDRQIPRGKSKLYYEVTLVTGGLAQIGWANLFGDDVLFSPNDELGDGVGDDAASFAVDGSRGLKFHGGTDEPFPVNWKAGDRLGCLFDCHEGGLTFTLDGKDLGRAFSAKSLKSSLLGGDQYQPLLVPAFSCNQGEILELHTTRKDCKYFPLDDSVIAVKDLVQDAGIFDGPSDDEDPSGTTRSRASATTNEHTTGEKAIKAAREGTPLAGDAHRTEPPGSSSKATSRETQIKASTVVPEALDLNRYQSSEELEALGLDRLKSALMALQAKCGGTLKERALRLFSLKGLERRDYPKKVRAKDFRE